ncbi:hypothetical protein BDV93DRAFT_113191 [Ceratobasidium sp. AG-I]|nr:hypothetical protein BDV93DRAFT_113191 [Ceratobasidium sp. AG-I]
MPGKSLGRCRSYLRPKRWNTTGSRRWTLSLWLAFLLARAPAVHAPRSHHLHPSLELPLSHPLFCPDLNRSSFAYVTWLQFGPRSRLVKPPPAFLMWSLSTSYLRLSQTDQLELFL